VSRRNAVKNLLVNRHILAANKKHGRTTPPLSVQTPSGKSVRYGKQVDILDERGNVVASLVYRPETPLKCGATVWIEALHGVNVHDETAAVACKPQEFGDSLSAPTLFDDLMAGAAAPPS
jgi:hypothetical protein